MKKPLITKCVLPSYHMHSEWSDGGSSIAELVRAAEMRGFSEIGISDHLIVSRQVEGIDSEFAMPQADLQGYVQEIVKQRQAASIPVRLGIEVDYFPDTPEVYAEMLSGIDFDYVIGSVHFVNGFAADLSASLWEPLSADEIDQIYRDYWKLIAESAASGLFDVIGHLDLLKKFGYLPSSDLSRDVASALDAIFESGAAVELNTAGWDKSCASPYPGRAILAECCRREIPLMLSDDAHHPDELGRYFDRAVDVLKEVGYKQVFRIEKRERIPLDL